MPTITNNSAIDDASVAELVATFIESSAFKYERGAVTEVTVQTYVRHRKTEPLCVSTYIRMAGSEVEVKLTIPSRAAIEEMWTPLTKIAAADQGLVPPELSRMVAAALDRLLAQTHASFYSQAQDRFDRPLLTTADYNGVVVPLRLAPVVKTERPLDEKREACARQIQKVLRYLAHNQKQIDHYLAKREKLDEQLTRLRKREAKLASAKRKVRSA
jgi:hypothetical protein